MRPPTDNDPRSLLERIILSSHFQEDDRLGELLLYICYQTQAGTHDALNEHDIGVNVLGLDPGYDTKENPIVADSLERVRGLLKQYFATDGRRESVRVALPRHEYRAFFYEADPKDVAGAEEPTALEKFWAPYWQLGGRNYLLHGDLDGHTMLIPEAYLVTRIAVLFAENNTQLEILPASGAGEAVLVRGNCILTGIPEHNPILDRFAERVPGPIVERIWRTEAHGVLTLLTAPEPTGLLDAAQFVTELPHLEKVAQKYEQQSFPPFFKLTIDPRQ